MTGSLGFDRRSQTGWQKHCELQKCDWIPPPQSLLLSQRPDDNRISRQDPEKGGLRQEWPTNQRSKKHPKTQHTRKRRKLAVPKICVFGCVAFLGALCSTLRGRQNTRKRNTPETADFGNDQLPAFSGVLFFFWVCFGACQTKVGPTPLIWAAHGWTPRLKPRQDMLRMLGS